MERKRRKARIPWVTRVAVFRSYRANDGNVYRVAKLFKIARLTVSNIVRDFADMGFSSERRVNLSEPLLLKAQEAHLNQITSELHNFTINLSTSPERALFELRAADSNAVRNAGNRLADSMIGWHLKGTESGDTISEITAAITDYNNRCLELWDALADELSRRCDLSVKSVQEWQINDFGPFILDKLIDFLYERLFKRSPDPPTAWLRWNIDEGKRTLEITTGQTVAVGGTDELEKVRESVEGLLNETLNSYIGKSKALSLLYHDISYVEPILRNAMRAEPEEKISQGICPECPFPEASIGSST